LHVINQLDGCVDGHVWTFTPFPNIPSLSETSPGLPANISLIPVLVGASPTFFKKPVFNKTFIRYNTKLDNCCNYNTKTGEAPEGISAVTRSGSNWSEKKTRWGLFLEERPGITFIMYGPIEEAVAGMSQGSFEYRGVFFFKEIFLRLICIVSEFGKISTDKIYPSLL
jgi:hypothetical protein